MISTLCSNWREPKGEQTRIFIFRLWSSGCRSRYQGFLGRLKFVKSPFCIIGESGRGGKEKLLSWTESREGGRKICNGEGGEGRGAGNFRQAGPKKVFPRPKLQKLRLRRLISFRGRILGSVACVSYTFCLFLSRHISSKPRSR